MKTYIKKRDKIDITEIIDVSLVQKLQDALNAISSFPSALIDIDGRILTATAWQEVCTKFHRKNPQSRKACIKNNKLNINKSSKSDSYCVSYRCPHGLMDFVFPIIIDNKHLANFFTGQFFVEEPDLDFFRKQAKKYKYKEDEYIDAIKKVPIWPKKKIDKYLNFIKELVEILVVLGTKNLNVRRARELIEAKEQELLENNKKILAINEKLVQTCNELNVAKNKADELNKNLLEKNHEYESLNEELRQTNEELLRAKEAAIESEKNFRLLFENMTQGFALHEIILDKKGKPIDYRFIEINKAFEKLTGLKRKLLIGKTVKEVLPRTEDYWIEKYGEVALKGKPVHFENFSVELNRYYDVVAFSPKKNFFAVIFNDVTKNKMYEKTLTEQIEKAEEYGRLLKQKNEEYESLNEELKQTNEELIKAKEKAIESDELKTAFLQNLSHEIRTPLNAICGFSELLSRQGISEEKKSEFINIILSSSHQLLSIVNDILTIASLQTKQEKVNIEPVNINETLFNLHRIFSQQLANKKVELSYYNALPDNTFIYTDKTKLTQIFTNLISNSIKFTHQGNIELGYRIVDDKIEFYVKDTGIGIDPKYHQLIFERFRQAENAESRKYGGTGLGLTISKGFVELLGGEIRLESEKNKGSIFYFTIPYKPVNEKFSSKKKNKRKDGYRHKSKVKILIAEDEKFNFKYLSEALSEFNVDIIHAQNGEEAVEIYKTDPKIFMILMDIKMPIMDGYEAAKRIRKYNPQALIIAQTAYALEEDFLKFKNVFNEYLTKPIKEEELKSIVMKYIDKFFAAK